MPGFKLGKSLKLNFQKYFKSKLILTKASGKKGKINFLDLKLSIHNIPANFIKFHFQCIFSENIKGGKEMNPGKKVREKTNCVKKITEISQLFPFFFPMGNYLEEKFDKKFSPTFLLRIFFWKKLEIRLQNLSCKNLFSSREFSAEEFWTVGYFLEKVFLDKIFFLSASLNKDKFQEDFYLGFIELRKNFSNFIGIKKESFSSPKSKIFSFFPTGVILDPMTLNQKLLNDKLKVGFVFFFLKYLFIIEGDLSAIDFLGNFLTTTFFTPNRFHFVFFRTIQKLYESIDNRKFFIHSGFFKKITQKPFSSERKNVFKWQNFFKVIYEQADPHFLSRNLSRQFIKRSFQRFVSSAKKFFIFPSFLLIEIEKLLTLVVKLTKKKFIRFKKSQKLSFTSFLGGNHHIVRVWARKILFFFKSLSFGEILFQKICFILESSNPDRTNFSTIYHKIHPQKFTRKGKISFLEDKAFFFSIIGFSNFRSNEFNSYIQSLENLFLKKKIQKYLRFHFLLFAWNWSDFSYFLFNSKNLKKNNIFIENNLASSGIFSKKTCLYLKKLKKTSISKKLGIKKALYGLNWYWEKDQEENFFYIYESSDLLMNGGWEMNFNLSSSPKWNYEKFLIISFKNFGKYYLNKNRWLDFFLKKKKGKRGFKPVKHYCLFCFIKISKFFTSGSLRKDLNFTKSKFLQKIKKFLKKKSRWKNFFRFFFSTFFSSHPPNLVFYSDKDRLIFSNFEIQGKLDTLKRVQNTPLDFFSDAFKKVKTKSISVSTRFMIFGIFSSLNQGREKGDNERDIIYKISKKILKILQIFMDALWEPFKHAEKIKLDKRGFSFSFKNFNNFPSNYQKKTKKGIKLSNHSYLNQIRIHSNYLNFNSRKNFRFLKSSFFSIFVSGKTIVNPFIAKKNEVTSEIFPAFKNRFFLFSSDQTVFLSKIALNPNVIYQKTRSSFFNKKICFEHLFLWNLFTIYSNVKFFFQHNFFRPLVSGFYFLKIKSFFINSLFKKKKTKGRSKFFRNCFWVLSKVYPKINSKNFFKISSFCCDCSRFNPFGDLLVYYFFHVFQFRAFSTSSFSTNLHKKINKEALFLKIPLSSRIVNKKSVFKKLVLKEKRFFFYLQKKKKTLGFHWLNHLSGLFIFCEKKFNDIYINQTTTLKKNVFQLGQEKFSFLFLNYLESGLISTERKIFLFINLIQFFACSENFQKKDLRKLMDLMISNLPIRFVLIWLKFQKKSLRYFKSFQSKSSWIKKVILFQTFFLLSNLPCFLSKFSNLFRQKRSNFLFFQNLLYFISGKKKNYIFDSKQKKKVLKILKFFPFLTKSKKDFFRLFPDSKELYFDFSIRWKNRKIFLLRRKDSIKKKDKYLYKKQRRKNFLVPNFFIYLICSTSKLLILRKKVKNSLSLFFFPKKERPLFFYHYKTSFLGEAQELGFFFSKSPYFILSLTALGFSYSPKNGFSSQGPWDNFLKDLKGQIYSGKSEKRISWFTLIFTSFLRVFSEQEASDLMKISKILKVLKNLIKKVNILRFSFFKIYLNFLRLRHSNETRLIGEFQEINFLILSRFKFTFPFLGLTFFETSFIKIKQLIKKPSQLSFEKLKISFLILFEVLRKLPSHVISRQKDKLNLIRYFSEKALYSKNWKIRGLGVTSLKNLIVKGPRQKIPFNVALKISLLGISFGSQLFRERCNEITLIYLGQPHVPLKNISTFLSFQNRCIFIKNSSIRFYSCFFLVKIFQFLRIEILKKFFFRTFYLSLLNFSRGFNRTCNFLSGTICMSLLIDIPFRQFLIIQLECFLRKEDEKTLNSTGSPFLFLQFIGNLSKFTKGSQVKFLANIFFWFFKKKKNSFTFTFEYFQFLKIHQLFLSEFGWIKNLPLYIEFLNNQPCSFLPRIQYCFFKGPKIKPGSFLDYPYPQNIIRGQRINSENSFFPKEKKYFFFGSILKTEINFSKKISFEPLLLNCYKKKTKNHSWGRGTLLGIIPEKICFLVLEFWLSFLSLEKVFFAKKILTWFFQKRKDWDEKKINPTNEQEKNFLKCKIWLFLKRLEKILKKYNPILF